MRLAGLLALAGFVCVAVAAFLVAVPLGLFATGAGLLLAAGAVAREA